MMVSEHQIEEIVLSLSNGEIIAYPTESVFGLGCDPDNKRAVMELLAIKGRAESKGLILITGDINQLANYVAFEKLTMYQYQKLEKSWTNAITWLLPRRTTTPRWLTGQFDSLAVRITTHPLVKQLCQCYGKPIVSTSANLSGMMPAREAEAVEIMFQGKIKVLAGRVSGRTNPSEIRDIVTDNVIRQG